MKKVAIFGNAGGGKSTLARQLSAITGLPLHSTDKLKYRAGGDEVPHPEYLQIHDQLLELPTWIIDGFGCPASLGKRISAADTSIYLCCDTTHGLPSAC